MSIPVPLSIPEDVQRHGNIMELEGVRFLDGRGQITSIYKLCKYVEFKFIDGRKFTVTRMAARKLDKYKFTLRKARNDS